MSDPRTELEQALADAKLRTKAARQEKVRAEEEGDGDAAALAAEAIDAAVEEEQRARVALDVFLATGGAHGVVPAGDDGVAGSVAVALAPGTTQKVREAALEAAVAPALEAVAASLGVVLAAPPARYARERPGRDAEGRTVFDVRGVIEGDRLLPRKRG